MLFTFVLLLILSAWLYWFLKEAISGIRFKRTHLLSYRKRFFYEVAPVEGNLARIIGFLYILVSLLLIFGITIIVASFILK